MDTSSTSGSLRGISIASLIFAILGGAFYWWVPLGMVFSLTGMFIGIGDSTMARRRSVDYRLSMIALAISISTLSLDIVVAYLGLQTWTFGAL